MAEDGNGAAAYVGYGQSAEKTFTVPVLTTTAFRLENTAHNTIYYTLFLDGVEIEAPAYVKSFGYGDEVTPSLENVVQTAFAVRGGLWYLGDTHTADARVFSRNKHISQVHPVAVDVSTIIPYTAPGITAVRRENDKIAIDYIAGSTSDWILLEPMDSSTPTSGTDHFTGQTGSGTYYFPNDDTPVLGDFAKPSSWINKRYRVRLYSNNTWNITEGIENIAITGDRITYFADQKRTHASDVDYSPAVENRTEFRVGNIMTRKVGYGPNANLDAFAMPGKIYPSPGTYRADPINSWGVDFVLKHGEYGHSDFYKGEYGGEAVNVATNSRYARVYGLPGEGNPNWPDLRTDFGMPFDSIGKIVFETVPSTKVYCTLDASIPIRLVGTTICRSRVFGTPYGASDRQGLLDGAYANTVMFVPHLPVNMYFNGIFVQSPIDVPADGSLQLLGNRFDYSDVVKLTPDEFIQYVSQSPDPLSYNSLHSGQYKSSLDPQSSIYLLVPNVNTVGGGSWISNLFLRYDKVLNPSATHFFNAQLPEAMREQEIAQRGTFDPFIYSVSDRKGTDGISQLWVSFVGTVQTHDYIWVRSAAGNVTQYINMGNNVTFHYDGVDSPQDPTLYFYGWPTAWYIEVQYRRGTSSTPSNDDPVLHTIEVFPYADSTTNARLAHWESSVTGHDFRYAWAVTGSESDITAYNGLSRGDQEVQINKVYVQEMDLVDNKAQCRLPTGFQPRYVAVENTDAANVGLNVNGVSIPAIADGDWDESLLETTSGFGVSKYLRDGAGTALLGTLFDLSGTEVPLKRIIRVRDKRVGIRYSVKLQGTQGTLYFDSATPSAW